MTAELTLERAYHLCKKITVHHYENFPVASRLLPAKIRKHVYPIYAFARHADDLADEEQDREGLREWRVMLHRCIDEPVQHPIFMALADTIRQFDLPIGLFDKLMDAFVQDLDKHRYANTQELFRYCQNSANPVGRIILLLHDYRDERLLSYSDHICTALQLTNFLQDVQVDVKKGRIYIPLQFLRHFGVTEAAIKDGKAGEPFQALMKELIEATRSIFRKGWPLVELLHGRLRWEIHLTVLGGLTILDKIESINYNVLEARPVLNKMDWFRILLKVASNRTVII